MHPASFAWALTCCDGDRHEAEEALQSAYVRVLAGEARYSGRSSLRTWFFAVVRRTAAGARRREGMRRLLLERWARRRPESAAAPSPARAVEARDRAARVRAAVAGLPRRQRQVLMLVLDRELTLREAAEVLGIRRGSASVHYDRAKRTLRARLGPSSRSESRKEAAPREMRV